MRTSVGFGIFLLNGAEVAAVDKRLIRLVVMHQNAFIAQQLEKPVSSDAHVQGGVWNLWLDQYSLEKPVIDNKGNNNFMHYVTF